MPLNIYTRRKELGLTLEDIAKAVGVSKGTVKKWESGYIKNMRRDKIISLAKILDVSPIQILEIEGDTNFYTKILPLSENVREKYKALLKADFDVDLSSMSAILIEKKRIVIVNSKNSFLQSFF